MGNNMFCKKCVADNFNRVPEDKPQNVYPYTCDYCLKVFKSADDEVKK